jgi:tetratricopeptide (TPR) repeat protein
VADWAWVQTLQPSVATRHLPSTATRSATPSEFVTTLDPWVDHPYRFAAIWLTNSADEVRRADRLLEKALSYHPTDWRNRFYLGYNQFFYLQQPGLAARTLEPAIDMPGAPTYLGPLVTRLRAQGGDLDTAALFLQQLIQNAPDEYARAEYLKAYDEIDTELRARLLDQLRAAFVARNGRDLREPSELWAGPLRLMRRMPPPHPHIDGFEWVIDPKSGQIVSSFYGTRYELHVHPLDEAQRESWRADGELPAGATQRADATEAKP